MKRKKEGKMWWQESNSFFRGVSRRWGGGIVMKRNLLEEHSFEKLSQSIQIDDYLNNLEAEFDSNKGKNNKKFTIRTNWEM